MPRRGHDRQVVGEDVARAEHHAGQRDGGEQQEVHRAGGRRPAAGQHPRGDEPERHRDRRGDHPVDERPFQRPEQPGLLEQRPVVGQRQRERAAEVAEQRPAHRAESGNAERHHEEQRDPRARENRLVRRQPPPHRLPGPPGQDLVGPAAQRPGLQRERDRDRRHQQPGHPGREREARREVADRRVQRVGGQREVRVVGQRGGDAEVADRLGEADGQRGPDGRREDRHDQPQRLRTGTRRAPARRPRTPARARPAPR